MAKYDIKPLNFDEDTLPHLQILDGKSLHLKDDKKKKITELSGIAWDHDEQLLYAVSDEGILYHLEVVIHEDRVISAKLKEQFQVMDKEKKALKGKWSDTEGLALLHHNNGKKNDTELVISFENKPRVALYTPQGNFIKDIKIPKKLTKRKTFSHKNKALEAVVYHDTYGVITAGEYPLKEKPKNVQTLYSAKGREWSFKRFKAINSAITGLEILDGGDQVLVLERAWSGIANPLEIRLSFIDLNKCDEQNFCRQTIVGDFSTANGWQLDNFEGLAALGGNRYLMISDDNQSRFQRTVLTLIKIIIK